MIHLPCFSKAEGAQICKILFSIQDAWDLRNKRAIQDTPSYKWYTVGAPLYLDSDLLGNYTEKSEVYNEVLRTNFKPYLDILLKVLAAHTGYKTELMADSNNHVSLVGFHIHTSGTLFTNFVSRMHTDLQWKSLAILLGQDPEVFEHNNHYTFTIPVMIPYMGAFLATPEGKVKYSLNKMLIHSGQEPHALTGTPFISLPNDYRIMMQGHAILINDTLYLYW